jgi:ABC-type lipoprotein release transport system permease subunit
MDVMAENKIDPATLDAVVARGGLTHPLESGAYAINDAMIAELKSGEYGAMITEERAKDIKAKSGKFPAIGTPLKFTSGGGLGFKIREVPLVGIYKYSTEDSSLNKIVLADPQTVRQLASIQVATENVATSKSETELLKEAPQADDVDALFGAKDEAEDAAASSDASAAEPASGAFSIDFLHNYLKTKNGEEAKKQAAGAAETQKLHGGDWNFILLKLKPGVNAALETAALNGMLSSYGVRAAGWRTGAGNTALLALLIQGLFNLGMLLVSLAGIIAVINILLISVFRRTRELGSLRALGAGDAFVRGMVLIENSVNGFAAGIVGAALGAEILHCINRADITIKNVLLATILGGSRLQVDISGHLLLLSVLAALLLSLVSSIYPVEKAVRIQPIVAMRQG